MKDTISYPLFTKSGVHWNKFGATLVIDSLTKYFDKIFDSMPRMMVDYSIVNNKNWENESDVYENMNLIFKPKYPNIPHPKYEFIPQNDKPRPCLITIGDSYFWSIYDWGFCSDYFQDSQFWYYNKKAYRLDGRGNIEMDKPEFSFPDEVKRADCYMILVTDVNVGNLDYGFINHLYSLYYN